MADGINTDIVALQEIKKSLVDFREQVTPLKHRLLEYFDNQDYQIKREYERRAAEIEERHRKGSEEGKTDTFLCSTCGGRIMLKILGDTTSCRESGCNGTSHRVYLDSTYSAEQRQRDIQELKEMRETIERYSSSKNEFINVLNNFFTSEMEGLDSAGVNLSRCITILEEYLGISMDIGSSPSDDASELKKKLDSSANENYAEPLTKGRFFAKNNVDLNQLSDYLINLYNTKYSQYIAKDKLNRPLKETVRYISQLEMKLRTREDGVLGYNDGDYSFIAKGTGHELQTIVHENLHQLSSNCYTDGIIKKRKYAFGWDNIQINEAITELLTKRSLGDDYGPEYSLYSNNRDAMAILESSLGEELVAEAYFQNKPELLEQRIDDVLGFGHWEQLSEAFEDSVHSDYNTRQSGMIRRDNIIDRFMRATNYTKGGENEWIEILS